MLTVRLALAITDGELQRDVAAALSDLRAQVVADSREHPTWHGFLEHLAKAQPHIVLLDITQLPVPLDDAVGSIRLAASASVAALNLIADPESILRSVRAGANEYLYPPVRFTLRKMVERKLQEVRLSGGPASRGKVLGFVSAKGGCGATTIACHIARELGRRGLARGRQTLMADLDLNAGVAGVVLEAAGTHTLLDAVQSLYRMDADSWMALVSPAGEGLDVLCAPPPCAPREAFSTDRLRELMEFARGQYEWVVADLGRGWSPVAFDMLENADEAFLVFTPDVPALNQTRQMVELLLRYGVGEEKVRLVLNQAPKEMDLTVAEIERIMGVPVFAVVREARGAGREELLVPLDALGRQLYELAARTA